EPGEIEAALREHVGVREAVVVAREDEAGQKRLVAYVVGREGRGPSPAELRGHLQERMPEYMVPGVYVEVEELPRTPSGKLDRRSLPAPSGERMAEGAYVGPRTAVEEVLCGIWERVLKVERVGVEDNFFELGGDSILSIQIAARARAAGLQLSVQQIFHYQTIAELTAQVELKV